MRVATALGAVFVLCAGALLAGCSEPGTPSGGDPAGGVEADWNLSDADLNARYGEYVESLQRKYALDGPVVASLVRFVSAEEWPQTHVNCLAESGFLASVGGQGGVTYADIPVEQGPALSQAAANCEASYPIDPRYSMQLPTKRAVAQFHFLVDTVAPCVEGLGYSVTKPPSEQTWLDSYYGTGQAWSPFEEAAAQTSTGTSDLDELYELCPTLSDAVYPPL